MLEELEIRNNYKNVIGWQNLQHGKRSLTNSKIYRYFDLTNPNIFSLENDELGHFR